MSDKATALFPCVIFSYSTHVCGTWHIPVDLRQPNGLRPELAPLQAEYHGNKKLIILRGRSVVLRAVIPELGIVSAALQLVVDSTTRLHSR